MLTQTQPRAQISPRGRVEQMDPKRVASAALQGFFSITAQWGLRTREQRNLLGEPASATFYKWRQEKSAKKLDSGTLERISYIFGIHKALCILLPTERAAYEWVKKPNSAPLFNGSSALDRMLDGNVADLYEVRKYLDGERG